MTSDEPARHEPAPDELGEGSNALWYWIAVLIVMFMGIVVVMAVIQTHAQ